MLGLRLERKKWTNQRQYTLTKCVQAISARASPWGIQRRLVPSHARHGYQLVLKNTQAIWHLRPMFRPHPTSTASAIHNNRHLRPSCKPSAHMSSSAANGNRSADGVGCRAKQVGGEQRRDAVKISRRGSARARGAENVGSAVRDRAGLGCCMVRGGRAECVGGCGRCRGCREARGRRVPCGSVEGSLCPQE